MTCEDAQHHMRNGCQAILGLAIVLRHNIEKLQQNTGSKKFVELLEQMHFHVDMVEKEAKRIGEAGRDCGK